MHTHCGPTTSRRHKTYKHIGFSPMHYVVTLQHSANTRHITAQVPHLKGNVSSLQLPIDIRQTTIQTPLFWELLYSCKYQSIYGNSMLRDTHRNDVAFHQLTSILTQQIFIRSIIFYTQTWYLGITQMLHCFLDLTFGLKMDQERANETRRIGELIVKIQPLGLLVTHRWPLIDQSLLATPDRVVRVIAITHLLCKVVRGVEHPSEFTTSSQAWQSKITQKSISNTEKRRVLTGQHKQQKKFPTRHHENKVLNGITL